MQAKQRQTTTIRPSRELATRYGSRTSALKYKQQQQQHTTHTQHSCYKWKLVGKCGNGVPPHTIYTQWHTAKHVRYLCGALALSLFLLNICLFGRSHGQPTSVYSVRAVYIFVRSSYTYQLVWPFYTHRSFVLIIRFWCASTYARSYNTPSLFAS